MNQSKEPRRVHRRTSPVPELLEDRMVLSGGEGSTLAIMPGTVTTAGQVSTINFQISPSLFTAPEEGRPHAHRNRHRARPRPRGSSSERGNAHPDGKPEDRLAHRRLDWPGDPHLRIRGTTERLPRRINWATRSPRGGRARGRQGSRHRPASHQLLRCKSKGLDQDATGGYLLGILPARRCDRRARSPRRTFRRSRKITDSRPRTANYSFDADVNRDGIINRTDVKLARGRPGRSTDQDQPGRLVNLDPASNPAANDDAVQHGSLRRRRHPNATVTF